MEREERLCMSTHQYSTSLGRWKNEDIVYVSRMRRVQSCTSVKKAEMQGNPTSKGPEFVVSTDE